MCLMQSQWESTKTNTQILICLGDLLDCDRDRENKFYGNICKSVPYFFSINERNIFSQTPWLEYPCALVTKYYTQQHDKFGEM